MIRRRHPIAFLALTALLAVSAAAGEFNAVANLGDPLPAFADLPATDGSALSDSDLTEGAVVLVFLANHCPWVRGMDGDLVRLVGELGAESVRVVGVSVNHRDEDRLPAMEEHAAKAGYNFTYVYDESQALGRALGATRTPEYFVFDRDRKLVYMGAIHDSPARERSDGEIDYTSGDPTAFYVLDAVRAVLTGAAVPTPETKAHGCSVEYEG
jgi:peroxiredoxin